MQQLGSAAAREALLSAGAEAAVASPCWVDNHYRWIVWKLAAYERRCVWGGEQRGGKGAEGRVGLAWDGRGRVGRGEGGGEWQGV